MTPATATLSAAFALSVIAAPVAVAPDVGLVTETVGAVVSAGGGFPPPPPPPLLVVVNV